MPSVGAASIALSCREARQMAICAFRPLLVNAVGRKTGHAGHTGLIITSLHAAKDAAIAMLSSVPARLDCIKETTAQFTKARALVS